jgi:predicted secreted protein
MNIASFLVVYIIAWWLVFFIVLPFGVKRDDAPEEGHDTGAPINHMIGKKALWSTLAAGVILFAYWVAADVLHIRLV